MKCTDGERPKRNLPVSKGPLSKGRENPVWIAERTQSNERCREIGGWVDDTGFGGYLNEHLGVVNFDVRKRVTDGRHVPFKDMFRWVKTQDHQDVSGRCLDKSFTFAGARWYVVRCRKCERCRLSRRNSWIWRAKQEAKAASRVWAITLTFRPAVRRLIAAKAAAHFVPETTIAYQYSTVFARAARDRSRIRGSFRYLFTVETHKDRTPHLHGLVFESRLHATTWQILHKSWKHGFAQVKLADSGAIFYTCKYLMKEDISTSRIKASKMFGNPPPELEV